MDDSPKRDRSLCKRWTGWTIRLAGNGPMRTSIARRSTSSSRPTRVGHVLEAHLSEHECSLKSSSSSVYSEVLVAPLLRTVKSLSVLSGSRASTQNSKECFPDVYLAYEHRDDAQYNSFLSLAEVEGFRIKRVPQLKIRKAVDAVLGWKDKSIYEGITVVQMKLQGVP